jgi:hypothetical protein
MVNNKRGINPPMEKAVRQRTIVGPGGVVEIRLPSVSAGAQAEVIVFLRDDDLSSRRLGKNMTAADLLESGLVGMWADRKDLGDSVEFARGIRSRAETRS